MNRVFRRRSSLWKDALLGAVSGAVASWVMTPAMNRFQKWERPGAKQRESAVNPSEMPTAKVARKAAEWAGVTLDGAQKQKGASAVHYAYGAFWGALFGALHDRSRIPALLQGLLFGTALGLASEAVFLPALRLAPPAHKYPLDTHLAGLASHWVYGAAADRSFTLLKRLLN